MEHGSEHLPYAWRCKRETRRELFMERDVRCVCTHARMHVRLHACVSPCLCVSMSVGLSACM